MDLDDNRWMEEVDRRCEQLRRDEELAAKLAAQFEFEDAMQAKDEEVAADLAAKLVLEDNLERLVRRFPDSARDVLRSLLEAFNGDVDCVIKELTPPGEFKEELHRAPVAVPQAEDGSGLLITGCNIAFPSLSQGAKAKKGPVAAATSALVRSSSTPTANAPKPTYASRAAELTTDDHFKWVRLLNQYPNIDDGELMNIFLSTGRHVPETIEKLERREKERRAPPPKPVEVPEERPKNFKYGIDPDVVRAEAAYHKEQAQHYLKLSNDPSIKQFPELAQYYRAMSEAHIYQYLEENDKAAEVITTAVNGDTDPFTLDLHFLYEKEAIERLTTWLELQVAELERSREPGRKLRSLKVITGKGLHSRMGIGKLQPAVHKYLTEREYRFDPMDGFFIVKISTEDIARG